MKPLIFDTFLYNGDEILTYRLEHLYDHVDYFIITESLETFSGIKKSSYYIDQVLPQLYRFIDKLIIIRLDQLPPRPDYYTFSSNNNPDDWWRERIQREACKPEIDRISNGRKFIAIVGDVDEIPSLDLLRDTEWLYARSVTPLYLKMDFFYYNFMWKKTYKWDQTYIKNDMGFMDEQLSQFKIFGDRTNHVNDGWHFSYFMSRRKIIEKINSIGHTEVNKPQFKTNEHINACLTTGRDLFDRGGHENCILNADFTAFPRGWEKFQKMLEIT